MRRIRTRTLSSASALALTLVAVPAAAQCAPSTNAGHAPASSPRTSVAASPTPSAAACVQDTLDDLSLAQQVGQLFVSGVDADRPTAQQLDSVTDHHLGGVILTGGSSAGVSATARVSEQVRDHATGSDGVGPWISTDQEGGYVQHLQGSGFDDMPTALTQGGWSTATLTDRAEKWGDQLHDAGVNLNLAPVLDTVPAELGRDNKPIGYYYREFGHTPGTVASHGTAFAAGMRAAGVQSAGKHFPGLGRVLGNTDTTDDVVDEVTTRDDPYLQPFQAAVDQGIEVVMISTARYTEIDADHLAAFSPTVMTDMLRGDLGFDGVIMSDDLGAAAAVQDVPAGTRAIRFLAAGGTVVLTVDPDVLPDMYDAVLDRAQTDPGFLAKVHDAAQHVLQAKQDAGLLGCGG
jgi:beta-N-acetylhexosaminidase